MTTTTSDEIRQAVASGRAWIEAGWVVGKSWNRLHHIDLADDDLTYLLDESTLFEPHRATCGQMLAHVSLPGLFTRLGAPRCGRCCDRTGLPRGVGSPKNDPTCRIDPTEEPK